jgi:nitroreductase
LRLAADIKVGLMWSNAVARREAAMGGGDGQLDVIDAIYSTRAMRRLRVDPVPERYVWSILDAAIRGPSGGNRQRWCWIVITDGAVKAQIGRWYLEAWNALGAGKREKLKRLLARITRSDETAKQHGEDLNLRSGAYLAHHIAEAPVWILAAQREVTAPTLEDGADIFGAIQNLMLAARKHGLGSTLTMLHRSRERDIAALLGLPKDVRTAALIPIGYPMTSFSPPVRKPVESVTHWERWGNFRSRPSQTAVEGQVLGVG